jgi:hypothetical protein
MRQSPCPSHRARATARVLAMAVTLAVAGGAVTAAPAVAAPDVRLPPANVKWDYQIGRAYAPPSGVALVSRDREAKPSRGRYTFCYVNAFQTQPQETRWWKRRHDDLLLKKRNGRYVVDSYWGEVLLDISTRANRRSIARIVNRWIDGCARDGFDAVEPDNLDSWTRSGGRLTKADAFRYSRRLIGHAHRQGLAIGQKNAAGQTTRGRAVGFDFAVAEECGRYHECGRYVSAYGNRVYVVEYRDQDFSASCDKWGSTLSIIRRDRNVTGPGSSRYVYDSC